MKTLSYLFLRLWCLSFPISIVGWKVCQDGSTCPNFNTCCPLGNGMSSCSSGRNATAIGSCCTDTPLGTTGCPPGYQCTTSSTGQARCTSNGGSDDGSYKMIPRYRLCNVTQIETKVHGFPIPTVPTYALAYLSNMGPIDSSQTIALRKLANIQTLVIVVHGALRNPDDLLCCTTQALAMTLDVKSSSVLILAPWFLSTTDSPVSLGLPNQQALRWTKSTWRYGADSVTGNSDSSSFAVLDTVLDYVWKNRLGRFRSLQKIVVAGHSSGGQYVQRWTLLSSQLASITIATQVVVASPMSFCFLDGRRVIDGKLQIPNATLIADCPNYNEWEWGLDKGDEKAPYRDLAVQRAGGSVNLVARYLKQSVVYLAGEYDTNPNGKCQDRLEGSTRTERSKNFLQSINAISGGLNNAHYRLVAPDIPHDHCLIFQSSQGRRVLFGN